MTFSRLMLGTVQFGLPYGIANTRGVPSDDEIVRILREAYDAGATSIDTSADYGTSEERLGGAMARSGLSGRFEVVTKIPRIPDGAPESSIRSFLREHLERSLRRLRIERLAAVLFHCESDAVHLPLLNAAIEKGDAALSGVSLDSSNHPAECRDARCVQIPCNILDHRFDGLIDTAGETDRIVFARSAFLQGLLLMPREQIPDSLSELLEYRDRLEALSRRSGYSTSRLALGYLLFRKGITSVVIGIETVEQLRENIRLASEPELPDDLFEELKNLAVDLPERLVRPMLWKN